MAHLVNLNRERNGEFKSTQVAVLVVNAPSDQRQSTKETIHASDNRLMALSNKFAAGHLFIYRKPWRMCCEIPSDSR